MLAQIVLFWLGAALAPSGWVILVAIVFTALYAMLARQVLAGVHWAQVVVWFLAGTNAFFGIVGLVAEAHLDGSDILGVVGITVNLALVALLARR